MLKLHSTLLAIAVGLALTACSQNESEKPAAEPAATEAPATAVPADTSTALTKEQVKTTIQQVGTTTYSAVDSTLVVVLRVTNEGTAALPFSGTKPVSVGIVQLIAGAAGEEDKRGADSRAPLPKDVAPGESVEVTARVPVTFAEGHKVQFELIQEGVAWFGYDFGQPTVVIGPFTTCANAAQSVCGADGQPVATQP